MREARLGETFSGPSVSPALYSVRVKLNTQLADSSILLTVKTFVTLAMGNIVLSVGLILGIAELFITPYSPRQMTLSMYTMLAVTALYKS